MKFDTLITSDELAKNPGIRILDCRHSLAQPDLGKEQYHANHIPGALHVHLDDDLSGTTNGTNGRHPLPDTKKLNTLLGRLGIHPGDQIVAYDDTDGIFAARLWWLLRWIGHASVAVLDGGLQSWTADGGELTDVIPSFKETTYHGNSRTMGNVGVEAIEENLKMQAFIVLDARNADRYAGKNETIDPVGGHIPGALNRPYSENLVNGKFKSRAQLKQEFTDLLVGYSPETVVHQCGSGVTACHNLLAMESAGMSGSILYAGSWSQWCSDSNRPISIIDPVRKQFINGQWVTSNSTRSIPVYDATNGQVLARVSAGDSADAKLAVRAAVAATNDWQKTSPQERSRLLLKIKEGIKLRSRELAEAITREVGMPLKLSKKIQVGLPIATFDMYANIVNEFAFETKIEHSLVLREPVGVVACITPWNYPLHQVATKIAAAFAAGCTVVLKPSEIAPTSALILAEIIQETNLPPGVFNLVTGHGNEIGEALVLDPEIDMVSFTGSTKAGIRISELASKNVKRVALELGGKSPAILMEGADFTRAVKHVVNNCYLNSGQTCTAYTRLLVPEKSYDEISRLTVEAAKHFVVGDPFNPETKLGPLASLSQQKRVQQYKRNAITHGAELLYGGTEPTEGTKDGYYTQPAIFGRVDPNSAIAQEEIFGPVLSILTYTDEDDAVRIANDTIYGLSGAVWAKTNEEAIRVARRLRTGQIDINGGAFNLRAPFGGFKQSGTGRELGIYGLEEFLEYKAIQMPPD